MGEIWCVTRYTLKHIPQTLNPKHKTLNSNSYQNPKP